MCLTALISCFMHTALQVCHILQVNQEQQHIWALLHTYVFLCLHGMHS
jgi:hypothetical protein